MSWSSIYQSKSGRKRLFLGERQSH
jgi:hypothetical protein